MPHHRAIALLGLVACAKTLPPEEAPDSPATVQPEPGPAQVMNDIYGAPPTMDDTDDTDVPVKPRKPVPR